MGLRERKKEEMRVALSWAAVRLAVEHGYDNVKVEDIAAAAGVSPRTFNNYFSSKAEAIAARHFERASQIAQELRSRPADERLWEAISNAVASRYGLGLTDAPTEEHWAAGVTQMMQHAAIQGEFLRASRAAQEELAAAVAERTGTDLERDLYPHLVAGAVGAAMSAVTDLLLRSDSLPSVTDLLRDAINQLTEGLPTP